MHLVFPLKTVNGRKNHCYEDTSDFKSSRIITDDSDSWETQIKDLTTKMSEKGCKHENTEKENLKSDNHKKQISPGKKNYKKGFNKKEKRTIT